jgi:hypothetical protein
MHHIIAIHFSTDIFIGDRINTNTSIHQHVVWGMIDNLYL